MVIAGKAFSAFVTVATYLVIILLGLRIVYGTIKNVLSHPFVLLVISSLMLFYNECMGSLTMRAMMDLYGFTYLLYLLLINLYLDILKKDENSVKKGSIVAINVVGFLAGISHELIGAWFIFQLIFATLIRRKSIKATLKKLRYMAGTLMGYIICFIAPGNFARMGQAHESGLNTPILSRMKYSLYAHICVLLRFEDIGKLLFACITLLAVVALGYLLVKKHFNILLFLTEIGIYMLVSVVLWGMVASVPTRGLYGVLLYLFLAYAKIFYEAEKLLPIGTYHGAIALSCLACGIVVVDCASWISSMTVQAINRETLIAEATAAGEEDVIVPRFTEECNRSIFMLETVDSQDELDWFYYTKMYGTHVILEE